MHIIILITMNKINGVTYNVIENRKRIAKLGPIHSLLLFPPPEVIPLPHC